MQLRTKVKAALAGLAIAGGAAAAVLVGPAGPALGFFSPPLLLEIHVDSPATLVAKGAAVAVSVQIQCAGARSDAFIDLSLTERAEGGGLATGFAFAEVKCTDQTVHFTVIAQSGGKAFKAGSALADASVFACAPRFCASEQDQRTIKLVH
jgi:hypothetical protein